MLEFERSTTIYSQTNRYSPIQIDLSHDRARGSYVRLCVSQLARSIFNNNPKSDLDFCLDNDRFRKYLGSIKDKSSSGVTATSHRHRTCQLSIARSGKSKRPIVPIVSKSYMYIDIQGSEV